MSSCQPPLTRTSSDHRQQKDSGRSSHSSPRLRAGLERLHLLPQAPVHGLERWGEEKGKHREVEELARDHSGKLINGRSRIRTQWVLFQAKTRGCLETSFRTFDLGRPQ